MKCLRLLACAAILALARPALADTVLYTASPGSYPAVSSGLTTEYATTSFPPLSEDSLLFYAVPGVGPTTLNFRMHADSGAFVFQFGYYFNSTALNSIDTSTIAGKEAYAMAALAPGNAVVVFDDAIHDPGATASAIVPGGSVLGFFLIPDETLLHFQTTPGDFAVHGSDSATFGDFSPLRWPLFGNAPANPGDADQLMSFSGTSFITGNPSNLFAWEDLTRAIPPGGSDNAFNDLIFAIEGVEAVIPEPSTWLLTVIGGVGMLIFARRDWRRTATAE